MFHRNLVAVLAGLALTARLSGAVVINEVMYHAPDDLDDLQYVELHNGGNAEVDLSGWSFSKGIQFTFAPGTKVAPGGFVVVCRSKARFGEFYSVPVAGEFSTNLKKKGERLELRDAAGRVVDSVKYDDKAPWPTGADGESGSLERIAPGGPSDDPANWTSSPLQLDRDKPGGTPGRVNAGHAAEMGPVVTEVSLSPEFPKPGEPVTVRARLRSEPAAVAVRLLHRVAGPGFEREEGVVPMEVREGVYVATVPAPEAGQLLRVRVQAEGRGGVRRHWPAETDPRPAVSAYVPMDFTPAAVPFGWILHTTEREMKAAEELARMPAFGMFRPPDPAMIAREEARAALRGELERGLDLSEWWMAMTVEPVAADAGMVARLREVVRVKASERAGLVEEIVRGNDPAAAAAGVPGRVRSFRDGLAGALAPVLGAEAARSFAAWREAREKGGVPFESMIRSRADFEAAWYLLTLESEPDPARWSALQGAMRGLLTERRKLLEEVAAGTGKDAAFRDQRDRAESLGDRIGAVLRPHLTAAQVERLEASRQQPREVTVGLRPARPAGMPRGFGFGPGGPGGRMGFAMGGRDAVREPGSHRSAYVHFDPATRKLALFDFVDITGRKGGQKVHFHGDRPLGTMTTVALIFEGDEAAVVEPLAYEVYRRAGMPVEQSFPVRLWLNGKASGYSILIEQPNKAFLRRNGIDDGGTMYKLLWFGDGLAGQHEKHSHKRTGHAELEALMGGLEKAAGAAQWEYIRKHFDVPEVANYFAVNMVLSHWDGFFNNYFTYHDAKGTGKWMMFPWDQDSTWGLRGLPSGRVFSDMALTFGMNGDTEGGGGGPWRPPGWFSGPLLANPEFRKVFLGRVRHLLENVYTEAAFGPFIDDFARRMEPEVRERARVGGADPDDALERFRSDLARCRQHIRERREFLLGQAELKALPR